jgi:hypothetical protein
MRRFRVDGVLFFYRGKLTMHWDVPIPYFFDFRRRGRQAEHK